MVVSYDLRIKYVIKKVIGKRVVRKGKKNTSKVSLPKQFYYQSFFYEQDKER